MSDSRKPRIGPITFTRQVRAEGSKVTWTSGQETLYSTIMVVVLSVLVSIFLLLSDQIVGWAVRLITGL